MVVLNTIIISAKNDKSMNVFKYETTVSFIQEGSNESSIGSVIPLYKAHIMMKRSQY